MWICDPEFLEQKPINIFHRHMDKEFAVPENPEELKNFYWLMRKTFCLTGKECFLEISADDYFKMLPQWEICAAGTGTGISGGVSLYPL